MSLRTDLSMGLVTLGFLGVIGFAASTVYYDVRSADLERTYGASSARDYRQDARKSAELAYDSLIPILFGSALLAGGPRKRVSQS